MTRVCSAMCGSSAGKMRGLGGLMGEGRSLWEDCSQIWRSPLPVGGSESSLPVWTLHVTWASSQHRALVGRQASYTGLRASGGTVPANKAEAA